MLQSGRALDIASRIVDNCTAGDKMIARAFGMGFLLTTFVPGAPAAELPIFDAHIHYSHDAWDTVPPAQAIALLRKAGVQRALVSSSNDDGNQRLYAAAPDLILPSLRPYRTRADVGSWAHSGFERPERIREMLKRHPNLRCDLAFRSDHASGGKVDAEWRALFFEFPDRFLLGTDTYTPERWHFVGEHAGWSRGWLADLPPPVAEGIAFRNGEALFGAGAQPGKP